MNIHDKWLGKLGNLHPSVSNSRGPGKARFAPHKPILLLSLIDLAEAGELRQPLLGKTPELRLRFDSYWAIVQPRWGGRPGLDLPFHHLSTQGFWRVLCEDGSVSVSPDTTKSLQLDAEFYLCLTDKSFCEQARIKLVSTWFTDLEQAAFYAALGFTKAQVKKASFRLREDTSLYQEKGRDARFRITVVTQYRFTCALTGYGLHTSRGRGSTLVEAAHIHAFSQSRNDNPDNGLALSRDAHWMFDEHLWTIDDSYRVVVADEVFTEWGPEAYWLKKRHGQTLMFMEGVDLRPNKEYLARHRSGA